jgi:16S rRNA (cytosine967-C5)-methyltransferase
MPQTKVSPSRWAAYKILSQVAKENAFTSILLPQYEDELIPEDRGLCHELTLGVIRNQTFLDKTIEHFSGKKLGKLDLPVLLALRLGIYQIRFMTRIPARAAINESVELVKKERLLSASGFVNAILRKVSKEIEFDPTAEIADDFEKLSIKTSHPLWLIKKWAQEFGFEETERLAEANNRIPQISFRANRRNENDLLRQLDEAGIEYHNSNLVSVCFIVSKANRKLYDLAEEGELVLQDEASQLVAHLVDLQPGESFFDVCAAPGNKTTQIINSVPSRETALYAAGDLHQRRIDTLQKNLWKAQIEGVKVRQYDAEKELPFEPETFDRILVDAPCSGTGTIRHNPEIRWSLKQEDFGDLAEKQKKILTNAAALLKKGGTIVYSTCSLEEEENEKVVEDFLRENPEFKLSETTAPKELITGRGFVRTFPQRDNTDGFFAAVLNKKF